MSIYRYVWKHVCAWMQCQSHVLFCNILDLGKDWGGNSGFFFQIWSLTEKFVPNPAMCCWQSVAGSYKNNSTLCNLWQPSAIPRSLMFDIGSTKQWVTSLFSTKKCFLEVFICSFHRVGGVSLRKSPRQLSRHHGEHPRILCREKCADIWSNRLHGKGTAVV